MKILEKDLWNRLLVRLLRLIGFILSPLSYCAFAVDSKEERI